MQTATPPSQSTQLGADAFELRRSPRHVPSIDGRTAAALAQPQIPPSIPAQTGAGTEQESGLGQAATPPMASRASHPHRRVMRGGYDETSNLLHANKDALLFVMAARQLLQAEQVPAARHLLGAAPSHVLSDPLIASLRSLLSPPSATPSRKNDAGRSLEYKWLRAEAPRYRGLWVALSGDRLLASAATLLEIRELLRRVPTSERPPLIHRVE